MNTNKPQPKECIYDITGKVQGVAYRVFVRHTANQLGIKGIVENKKDGSVHVVAQGSKDVLEQFAHKLKHGVHHAQIADVRTTWREPIQMHDSFSIRHTTI